MTFPYIGSNGLFTRVGNLVGLLFQSGVLYLTPQVLNNKSDVADRPALAKRGRSYLQRQTSIFKRQWRLLSVLTHQHARCRTIPCLANDAQAVTYFRFHLQHADYLFGTQQRRRDAYGSVVDAIESALLQDGQ